MISILLFFASLSFSISAFVYANKVKKINSYVIKLLWEIKFKTKEYGECSTQICAGTKQQAIDILKNNSSFARDKTFELISTELVEVLLINNLNLQL